VEWAAMTSDQQIASVDGTTSNLQFPFFSIGLGMANGMPYLVTPGFRGD
jgi:hypothetical protein